MVAYLVLSHVNSGQVVRLVRRLAAEPDAVVFLRHDGTHHPLPCNAFAGYLNVHVSSVTAPVPWGSFGQVQAVLDGIETALASGIPYEWMVLVSGQDYPCSDPAEFHRMLQTTVVDGYLNHVSADEPRLAEENAERYYFRYTPVPPRWRALNKRLWRLNGLQPFVRFVDTRVGSFFGVADRTPFAERQCYRGSFWWTLSRASTEELVRVARTEPAFVDAFRHRLHPDESFVQTALLSNPQFTFVSDDLRYMQWDKNDSSSPVILGVDDLPGILASRKPFARKFDTRVDADVLDRMDAARSERALPAPVLAPNFGRAEVPPRLSIGLPVYNGSNYVADAIRSILAQTYTDFELIVSDNASTDNTPDIVGEFAAKDSRVRFVRNAQNMGASYNFNHTFSLARGAYFRQAAHDDTLAPECLERCMDVLEADPSVALAYTRSLCIDENDQQLAEYANIMHFVSDDPRERFAAHLRRAFDRRPEANLGSNPACNPIFGIARTETLKKTPMVASYMASDMILLGELALYGKLVEVPETLFFIRAHPSNSWSQNPSIFDIAAWFDPANRNRVISYMPHLRWFREYAAAIRRAPLTPAERQGCYLLLLQWAAEQRKNFLREGASVGARYIGLRPWNGETAAHFGPPRVTA